MFNLVATRRGAALSGFVTFEAPFGAFAFTCAFTGRFGADFFALATLEAF
jgi:hypothetical protein